MYKLMNFDLIICQSKSYITYLADYMNQEEIGTMSNIFQVFEEYIISCMGGSPGELSEELVT